MSDSEHPRPPADEQPPTNAQPHAPPDRLPATHTPAPTGVFLPGNYHATADEPTKGPRGRRRLLLLATAALGGFVACAAVSLVLLVLLNPSLRSRIAFVNPVVAAPPEAPNKFGDPSAGPISIVDDFESDSRRWDRSQTSIDGGAYELSLELDNFDSYGLFLGAADVRDFDLAVDATMSAGPPNAEFGIRFRQSAPDEHLIFSISPSGFYRLARVSDKTYSSLVPWTRDERIRTGVGATNRLRVVADGPNVTGYINGEEIVTYQDDVQHVGQLTLGLVTFEQGGLTVRFDNAEGFAMSMSPDGQAARVEINHTFDDPETADWSVGGATVRTGAYEVFVGGGVLSWQQPLPIGSSEVDGDFVLEVDATMLSGDLESETSFSGYGIMFGDNGSFDFFALMIVPQGGMMLFRSGDESGMVIPPIPVDTVNPGLNATNKIRIEARGQKLNITINDEPVTVNGEPLPELELPEGLTLSGMVGVVIQGNDVDGVRARFDNFKLEEIE